MAWEELLNIAREAAGHAERERTDPPSACPYCGEPLDSVPSERGGGLFCPYSGDHHYRWP